MFYGVTENFKELKVKDGRLTLIAESTEIQLEDSDYRNPVDLAIELMGQCMDVIFNESGTDGVLEAIQDELDSNYFNYEIKEK